MAVDYNNIPEHVAIMMDGNGRWAKKRLLSKSAGHKAGAQTLKTLALEADKIGLKYLTVYAFSTENWNRPQDEIDDLMNLMRTYIQQYIDDKDKNNLRMRVIGDITRLDKDLQDKVKYLTETTNDKTGLCVNLAINYGGRDEITRAAKKIAAEALAGTVKINDITEEVISKHLDTGGLPDPALMIRTSGEMRFSNFLLWQISYSELCFIDTLWPDFKIHDLLEAISQFQKRERRFGGR